MKRLTGESFHELISQGEFIVGIRHVRWCDGDTDRSMVIFQTQPKTCRQSTLDSARARLFYNIITLYLFVPNESESSYGNTSEFNVLALVPD